MKSITHLEIPGHVAISPGNGGFTRLRIETAWSSAEVYLHGAHVTHFQKKNEAPLLFMSKSSEFMPKKPIRGGVPVIFPWFGGREGLPAHGLARTVEWDLKETILLDDGAVRVLFGMPPIESIEVDYLVTVAETLSLELIVRNSGNKNYTFETCLHTYFQIGDIHRVSVSGLKNTACHDKLTDKKSLETAEIRFASELERVYSDSTGTVEIHDPELDRVIRVEKSGSGSTVVWNPWIDKSRAMPDFGDDEYLQMVCVESGNVANNRITLPSGEIAVMKVDLSSRKPA